jgi:putative Holliday junction resolvase
MESRITMAAKKFAVKLNKKFKQPVKLVDEKLSSREAKHQARETSKSVNLTRVDHLAAALILQTYLNHPESATLI